VNDRFCDLTAEVGPSRDTYVPQPRIADTDRTRQSRPDALPSPDRSDWAWDSAADQALAARSPADITQAGDPVDVATGDVLLFQEDVSLPGLLPLLIGRVYRSSWRAGRWFGPAWASSLDQRLRITPDRIVGVFADGRVLSWPCRSGPEGPMPLTGLPVTGPRWRLERAGHDAFTVTDPQAGLTWRFAGKQQGRDGELPLTCVSDRRGGQIRFEHTEHGEPAWITHSGGYRVRVVMSGGRVAELRLVTPAGEERLAGYRYDPAGNLAATLNGSGRALRLSYDGEGRLTGWRDRNGVAYRYSYDERGRCVAGTGPDGIMSGRFAYGDRVTWWTDAAGAVTIYQLDASSRVTAVTDPLGHVTHLWYDEYGLLTARADPLGRLTRYAYDERGNLTCITRPDGSKVRARYDTANLLAGLEEPDGVSWRQEHDARGNLVRQIAPDQSVTSYCYDQRGHLASMTGPLRAVTTVDCDAAGLPVGVTGPEGDRTRYARDAAGRVTAVTAPDGTVTTLNWTADGLLAGRVFPDGGSERREYDVEGNLITYVSPSGERTGYEYGPFDRLTAVTGPDGARTEFGYDRGLRLTTVTHAGLTWQYDYDAAGRMTAETDFNGAVTRYVRDPAGQLTSRVNAAGQEVSCCYDELGRLVRRVADGTVSTFGYDAAGRLVRAANPDAELRLTRDPLGRVTAETCGDRTVLSSYDLAGHRTRRVTPGGARERWSYDLAGRPVRLETGGHTLGFGYDHAGRETRRGLPGGLALTQDWDTVGQLARQTLTAAAATPWTSPAAATPSTATPSTATSGTATSGTAISGTAISGTATSGTATSGTATSGTSGPVLARRAYSYRPDGYPVGVDDLLAGDRRFTLDEGGRIIEVAGARWAERYRYDPAGNIASARWSAPPPTAASDWLSADLQGPRERSGTLITSAGTVRYRHDPRGRVIERQRTQSSRPPATWSYQWDADDRLTAVTTPDGSTWRYRYDPLGRRIAKQRFDPSGAPAEETTFTWDGAVLAEESSGELGRRRRLTWDYRPGTCTALTQSEHVSASDAPQEVIDERFYAIIADQVGTPAELIAADGTVAGYQQHTLWGGTLWRPGGAATPLRFPGQYHDRETGLHYNHQRYYDPVTGSYLTPDPLGLAPAPNPHAYVPNPLTQTDPLGLMSCSPGNTHFPDETLVVRGGVNTRERFAQASGSWLDAAGRVYDVSVQSAPGRSIEELAQPIPNKQIGVSDVGSIRAAGGSIQAGRDGSYHCVIGGCTPEQFSELFTPTIKNPWK
jgi:RHS repeat-associated protein